MWGQPPSSVPRANRRKVYVARAPRSQTKPARKGSYPGRSVTAFPPAPGNTAFTPPANAASKLTYE
jgi:hypothetical protein